MSLSEQSAPVVGPDDGTVPADRRRVGRLPSLTGLRFPAAFLVFVFHASLPFPEIRLLADDGAAHKYNQVVGQIGALGVTFFFVLSGFVLTWSARDGDSATSFWRRRFVKIMPNYVVAWILAMVLYVGAKATLFQSLGSLFMLQVWTPYFTSHLPVNPPSWSLAVEAVFYLAFPLIYLGVRRIPAQRLKFWIIGAIVAVAATPLITTLLVPAGPEVMAHADGTSPIHYWFAYILPIPRLLDFGLGILVARAVMLGRWRDIGMLWSGLLVAASYVVCFFVPYLYGLRVVFLVPAVMLTAAAAIADNEGRFTLFRNRAMVWLGEISFAFYMVHYIVLAFTRKLLGPDLFSTPAGFAIIAGQAVLTLLVSWALYAGVERPITRRWSVSRRKTAAARM
ncbi:acyltransferase family protein [Amycolatopsis alba]|uniref:Acyltransferase n=1 Tax=Amycolatopsis alba DSM 44262 TaxID=1125972 RepID=A0A229S2I7_AMYAL|nr:acyltransferase [Amycolatopsis alba DSM 44262]